MIILDILKDALLDSLKIIPFLFVAFLALEFLEHHTGSKINNMLAKSGKASPLIGAAFGCIPQCGFSVIAANLYSARIISIGALISVFVSTSDEAVLILMANPGHGMEILKLIGVKVIIALIAGYSIDFIFRKKPLSNTTGDLCEDCGCHEQEGIIKPALYHTVKIFGFLLLFTTLVNLAIGLIGPERLSSLLLGNTFFQPIIAALIGLIPNCAASVILTELYLEGAISFASVVAGLCAGAGVGLAVLFKTDKNKKEGLKVVGLLFSVSVIAGMVLQLFGI
ncbi:MAG: putative manganese transporter [Oscillospiraceae bacterium]